MQRIKVINDTDIKKGFDTLICAFSLNKDLCVDTIDDKYISAEEKANEYMLMDVHHKETFSQKIINKVFKTNYHTRVYSFKNSITRNYVKVNSNAKFIK